MATHGLAATRTRMALAKREAFKRHGFGMSAVTGRAWTCGQLPEPHRAQYLEAADAGRIVYTVLSYATPILWVLDSGEVVQPNVRYSVTTSNHQGLLYLVTNPHAAF